MNVLPICSISETEKPVFGEKLCNLASLSRMNFPVPKGVVISAPDIIFEVLTKHLDNSTLEIFDTRQILIKKDLYALGCPKELEFELSKHKHFLVNGLALQNRKEVWAKLIDFWVEDIKREFSSNISTDLRHYHLHPQIVIFIKKPLIVFSAYFDSRQDEVIILGFDGAHPKLLKEIDQMVIKADKKLVIPQEYSFALGKDGLFLINLKPFTASQSQLKEIIITSEKKKIPMKNYRPAVKIFLNQSSDFRPDITTDGILFEGGQIQSIEQTMINLIQAHQVYPDKPILYELHDIDDQDIRGALRLISQKSLLETLSAMILFLRNKKEIINLNIVIPFVRSVDELTIIKRELSSLGVFRKESLKFWMEVSVPENIININTYENAGIDGFIINLDLLQQFLLGFKIQEENSYKNNTATFQKLLVPYIKECHKYKLPVIIKGRAIFLPDVLEMLLGCGVWGVVVESETEAKSIPDYLIWQESRLVNRRFEA